MKISTLCKALVLVALVIAVAVPVCAWSGSGTSSSPYIISSYDDLLRMKDYPDAYFKQNEDITINNPADFDFAEKDMFDGSISGSGSAVIEWEPFDFSGNYNGNRKHIIGLYVSEDYANGGLFATMKDATVQKLNIEYALIEADEYAGILAGKAEGETTIEECSVHGSVIGKTTKEMNTVGGIVGLLGKGATITTSVSHATVTGATSYSANVGGVAGINNGTITMSGFDGNAVCGTATYYDASIGGIAGYNTGSVNNCRTAEFGKVSGESTAKINDCYVGGIVGLNKGTVQYCENAVAVSNKNYSSGDSICGVGGVVGMNLDTDLYNNTNKGAVSGEYCFAGGIAGIAVSDTGEKVVSGHDNTGAVTAEYGVAGGIVGRAVAAGEGYVSIKLLVENCYNAGALSGNKTGEMAGETANVESASVTVGAEKDSANGNSCTAYEFATVSASAEQYGSTVSSTVIPSNGAVRLKNSIRLGETNKYIVVSAIGKANFNFKPVMVTLINVADSSKVEILSVDASGLTLSGNTLSGNVVVKVYKPDTSTDADAVIGFSISDKYVTTKFADVEKSDRVATVTVNVNATVDVTGTITVNALVVNDNQKMEPLCENKKVTK